MSTALFTDRYELTMLDAALQSGVDSRRVQFEVFARSLPAGRRYGVFAGVGRVLDAIKNFKFSKQTLDWLTEEQVITELSAEYLSTYKFQGSIDCYREGELYFGSSPVMTVEGDFAEAVILETVILSILNFDTAIASAASRMRIAAGDRFLAEMGSRRGHEQAAVAAARSAFVAGFDATSNLAAGQMYGIPTMGTSAHAFTLLFDSESEAFSAQLSAMGESTTLLIDTYNIEEAVSEAIRLSRGKLGAVRIDSGDLLETATKVRAQLDSLGAEKTKITVTNDLDEYAIASLASAPVDSYGVGTSLITGSSYPTAGFVYKMVARETATGWQGVAKKSQHKANNPSRKYAYREIVDGVAVAEHVLSEPTQKPGYRPLQQEVMSKGEVVLNYNLQQSQNHHTFVIAELDANATRLTKGEPALATIT